MAGIPTRPVQVTCKKCNRPAVSTEFTLDPVYKMMVCKKCVEERRIKENPLKSAPTPIAKPAVRTVPTPVQRTEPVQVKPIPASKSKKRCSKCNYNFNYDPERRYPQNCPNCGTPVKTGPF
ncbi:TPA: hypothetical protein HA265_00395 [Candidatus Woesearchaeota archaeon]|nr:hypothetical protein [Candidatus Woesearchaeota archaeon]